MRVKSPNLVSIRLDYKSVNVICEPHAHKYAPSLAVESGPTKVGVVLVALWALFST